MKDTLKYSGALRNHQCNEVQRKKMLGAMEQCQTKVQKGDKWLAGHFQQEGDLGVLMAEHSK